MEEQKNLEKVIKELEKHNINYDELSIKEKEMLIKAYEWMKLEHEDSVEKIKSVTSKRYTLNEFCNKNNLNRSTLYQKKNNKLIYESVILFINSAGNSMKAKDSSLLRNYKSEYTKELKHKIDLLVKRDVEYMKLKERVKEQERIIKRLTDTNNELVKHKNSVH